MPEIRPFRGLRFEPDVVGDLAAVVSPPYDVISPAEQAALLARRSAATSSGSTCRPRSSATSPTTAIGGRRGRSRPGAPTARSARIPGRAVYVYEQVYRLPGSDDERTQRGFFGRLRLEPFGPGSGVLPHERTLTGPKEDRYKLLRATGANFSPVVGLYADPSGGAAGRPGRGRGRDRRRSTCWPTTGSAIASGSCRSATTARRPATP